MSFLDALGSGLGAAASGLGNFAGNAGQFGSGVASGAQAAAEPPGMFGAFHNWLSTADAGGLTGADKLNALGAGLKDMAPGSQGGNLAAAQNTIARRASDHALGAFADSQITDPMERLLFKTDPAAWAKARAQMGLGFGPGRGLAQVGQPNLIPPATPNAGQLAMPMFPHVQGYGAYGTAGPNPASSGSAFSAPLSDYFGRY